MLVEIEGVDDFSPNTVPFLYYSVGVEQIGKKTLQGTLKKISYRVKPKRKGSSVNRTLTKQISEFILTSKGLRRTERKKMREEKILIDSLSGEKDGRNLGHTTRKGEISCYVLEKERGENINALTD